MSGFHLHVQRAIKIVGGQAKLAAMIGRAQSEVWRLANTAQSISPDVAVAIARTTNGEVALSDLLPEIVAAVRAELERAPAEEAA